MHLLVRLDRVQAHLLRDLLAHHGIRAHVLNLHVQGAVGELPPEVALPQVWLEDPADLARARALLERQEADARRTDTRFCPQCAEENPGTFELCWQCGAAL